MPLGPIPEEEDLSEAEWLHAAATSPAFDFLKDPAEDVYLPTDGKPFVEGPIHD